MPERVKPLALIIMAATMVGFAISALLSHISVSMEGRGFSSLQIGLVHTAQYTAGFITGMFIPYFISRAGMVTSYLCAALLAALAVAAHTWAQEIVQMFMLRFLMGIAFSSFFAVIESWINGLADEKNRARVTSIYCAILVGGYSAGSWMLKVLPEPKESYVFWICASLLLASIIPLLGARKSAPVYKLDSGSRNPFSCIMLAPAIIITTAFYGLAENAILTLLQVYIIKSGGSADEAVTAVSIFMAGGMILMIPLGIVADKLSRELMLKLLLLLSILIAAGLAFVLDMPLVRAVLLFIWGGIMLALYPLIMAVLGGAVPKHRLAQATAGMVIMYGLGSSIGPTVFGLAMDKFGADGFIYCITGFLSAALILNFYKHKPEFDKKI